MYADKDNFFKEKYIQSLGEEIDSEPTDYQYKDFNALEFDNKLILDITSTEIHLLNSETINLKSFDNTDIGYIVLTKGAKINNYTDLSSDKVLYIWNEYRKNGEIPSTFKFDFLVIKKTHFEYYYDNHLKTSSLWGGFKHEIIQPANYKPVTEIFCPENSVIFPTATNESTSNSSLLSSNVFDIFLKKYHQLELIFNLIIVKQIQKININDLKKINSIYKNMNKDEIDTIFYIIVNFTSNSQKVKIFKIIEKAFLSYEEICEEILFEYGKESNPIKTDALKSKFIEFISKCNQDSPSNFSAYKEIAISLKFKNREDEFEIFTNKLISYMIYRVRCSIAHNKLSEFIFSTDQYHLDFMTDIALPLIKETVIDVFSNSEFNNLFNPVE